MLALLAIVAALCLIVGVVLALGAPGRIGPVYLAVGLVLLLIWSCIPAKAQEHRHPAQDSGIHHRFYSKWTMPDNRHISCCHDEDCFPAQSKYDGANWYARKEEGDEWIRIPDSKIERDKDSPDGRSHLCGRKYTFMGASQNFTVFCFIAGIQG